MANIKLHLGCGYHYLDGYINFDYPTEHHTVQKFKADQYADITKLDYPLNSVEEIRLHHVFEHFSRPVALALLCRWRNFLKPHGLLRLETPDAEACMKSYASPLTTFDTKQQLLRHMFGSHEAHWAVHWDGWTKEKYKRILTLLGFTNIVFKFNTWGPLYNIEVFAYKNDVPLEKRDYEKAVRQILEWSTVRVKTKDKYKAEGTEKELLGVWLSEWQEAYEYK